jgi:hypothetical protein
MHPCVAWEGPSSTDTHGAGTHCFMTCCRCKALEKDLEDVALGLRDELEGARQQYKVRMPQVAQLLVVPIAAVACGWGCGTGWHGRCDCPCVCALALLFVCVLQAAAEVRTALQLRAESAEAKLDMAGLMGLGVGLSATDEQLLIRSTQRIRCAAAGVAELLAHVRCTLALQEVTTVLPVAVE